MTVKKRCTRLNVHRAHSWTVTHPQQTYLCEGVAEEVQNPAYMTTPYVSDPVVPYYAAPTHTASESSDSSSCDSSYSSSDTGSSPSCE
jgi:hypothetical protein